MKIEVTIPNNLNEITLGQYQKFLSIAENNKEGEFLNAKMIEIFWSEIPACSEIPDPALHIFALDESARMEPVSRDLWKSSGSLGSAYLYESLSLLT